MNFAESILHVSDIFKGSIFLVACVTFDAISSIMVLFDVLVEVHVLTM